MNERNSLEWDSLTGIFLNVLTVKAVHTIVFRKPD
jgi:hypothetical protein